VKIQGQVSAVQSAVAAARAAASRISKVFATSVIPRPSDQLDPVVLTDVTVGLAKPSLPAEPLPEEPVRNEPAAEPLPEEPVRNEPASRRVETPPVQPLVEPVETPVSTSSTSDVGTPPSGAKPRTRKPSTTRTKK
jgi:hypothetical protein